jgi:hypothetical protein
MVTRVPPLVSPMCGATEVIDGTGGAIVDAYDCDPVHPLSSVAVIVNVNGPAALGVPPSVPDPDSVSPAGSVPEVTANVYGEVPPVALIVWL